MGALSPLFDEEDNFLVGPPEQSPTMHVTNGIHAEADNSISSEDEECRGILKNCNGNAALSKEPPPTDSSNGYSNAGNCVPNGGALNKDFRGSCDSLVDTIPFGMEGIQTVIKNQWKKDASKSYVEKLDEKSELFKMKQENQQLRKALKEAAYVNQQWRNYHDQRQGYVQKLLASLSEFQSQASNPQHEGKAAQVQILKETLSRQQKEHEEHVQLLQLQVRAHRDDWEAERCEKKVAEAGRIQAESQVDILQKQMQHLMVKVTALEAHQKMCRCRPTGSLSHSPTFEDNLQILNKDRRERVSSPSKYSSASSYGSRSRSSSLSTEFSNPTSPTMAKNLLNICSHSGHSSRSTSPRPKALSPSKMNNHKNTDSEKHQKNTLIEDQHHKMSIHANENHPIPKQKDGKCLTYENESTKLKNSLAPENEKKSCDSNASYSSESSNACESKGARPKTLPKLNCKEIVPENEVDAKHRARTILASALSMSPSSTKPPSPVSATKNKNYLPITSTVLTPAKCRPPFVAHKIPKSKTNKMSKESNENECLEQYSYRKSEAMNKEKPDCTSTTCFHVKEHAASIKHKERESHACKESETRHSTNDLKQTDNLRQSCENISQSQNISENISYNSTASLVVDDESEGSIKDYIMQESNFIVNSSSIHPPSQVTSATSSRSSSPGISLMTFALNADGQGVPGAIVFAIGSESKSNKSLQNSTCNLTSESSLESNQEKSNESGNARLVNSAWVKLMDKENSNSKSSTGIPWRTARVIPSHQLNSSRKSSREEQGASCEHLDVPQNEHKSSLELHSHDTGQNSSSSSNYNMNDKRDSVSNPIHIKQIGSSSTCLPLIYTTSPDSDPSQPDMDLKSMASRNITSAILSYECNNKEYKKTPNRNTKNHSKHKSPKKKQ